MNNRGSPAPQSTPRVTIVMTARERRDLTIAAIESIHRNTQMPHRFVYAESQSPQWLRERLQRRAPEWGLEIIPFDGALRPNQIRKRIAPAIATDYVVFLDNDIAVRPGWLERLVACADETGAGIVCPLYFIGADADATRIHMAGGRLNAIPDADGRGGIVLEEAHHLVDRDRADVAPELSRGPCAFAEFHCTLMRSELAKHPSMFDDRIVCVHEHIDAALSAGKLGYPIYFEPTAEVVYLALAPYRLGDLEFFRARWATAAAETSIKSFVAKWNVIDEERSFGAVRRFVELHRTQVDPLRRSAAASASLQLPMQAHELKQTLSGLFELAGAREYLQHEWNAVERIYQLAMVQLNGAYRPCGRAFINHLAGTASVLMHYDFNVSVVAAGLLHAAYTHCAERTDGPQATADEICRLLGGRGSTLEKRVRAYTFRSERWQRILASPTWPSNLSIADTELLAITAANDVDMHLSGEFRFSGRRDMEANDVVGPVAHVCQTLGISGLAETLLIESQKLSLVPVRTESRLHASFRIVGDKLVPATNTAMRTVLARDEASS